MLLGRPGASYTEGAQCIVGTSSCCECHLVAYIYLSHLSKGILDALAGTGSQPTY
jgi:hypothetical protein